MGDVESSARASQLNAENPQVAPQGYGGPQPGYGPQGGYGAPPAGYGAPPPGYGGYGPPLPPGVSYVIIIHYFILTSLWSIGRSTICWRFFLGSGSRYISWCY